MLNWLGGFSQGRVKGDEVLPPHTQPWTPAHRLCCLEARAEPSSSLFLGPVPFSPHLVRALCTQRLLSPTAPCCPNGTQSGADRCETAGCIQQDYTRVPHAGRFQHWLDDELLRYSLNSHPPPSRICRYRGHKSHSAEWPPSLHLRLQQTPLEKEAMLLPLTEDTPRGKGASNHSCLWEGPRWA